MYAAHISDDGLRVQSVKEHLDGTAKMCRKFGGEFGFEQIAYTCGILHDIGKYSAEFQKHIHGDPKTVDHSTAGAQVISKLFPCGTWLAYCIAGHHSGLPDGGSKADAQGESSLLSRLNKDLPPYDGYKEEISQAELPVLSGFPITPMDNAGFSVSMAIRMAYSCLVDADFLDTEFFMRDGKVERGDYPSIEQLNCKLAEKLKDFKDPVKEINKKRTEILNCCIKQAAQDRNLFTLTVPTGGGKTFSSLAFALKHAKRNGMTRVIYVIPYTSIIEQNAQEFKKVLGENNVLEHHSNFDFNELNDEIKEKQRLACENWDVPIVVTTNVQFFESLFASKSSRCRKLHSIANSVIIFDEAQMLPTNYLHPCVYAIAELIKNYRCSAVLCSATQPALQGMFPGGIASHEIVPNTDELYNFFRRTKIVRRGQLTNEELANEINRQSQVLCVVSTKKHAKDLFSLLKGDGIYHLSALMCPKHRSYEIAEIKERLLHGKPCRVISTQIIEAGVDVDFPVVYRSMAGLDEIVQSAGRCNRENKLSDFGEVNLFEPQSNYTEHMPADLKRPINITQGIMRRYDDIMSPQAIKAFFSELYFYEGDAGLDKAGIMDTLESAQKTGSIPFKEIERDFHLIENNTKTIIIPYNDKTNIADSDTLKNLINKLKFTDYPKSLMRSLQSYTVSVYEYQYEKLLKSKTVTPVLDDTALLTDINQYSERTGLQTDLKTGCGIFI